MEVIDVISWVWGLVGLLWVGLSARRHRARLLDERQRSNGLGQRILDAVPVSTGVMRRTVLHLPTPDEALLQDWDERYTEATGKHVPTFRDYERMEAEVHTYQDMLARAHQQLHDQQVETANLHAQFKGLVSQLQEDNRNLRWKLRWAKNADRAPEPKRAKAPDPGGW